MTDQTRLPETELDPLAQEVRRELAVMEAVLAEAEFSRTQRTIALQGCEICRLENMGRVRERKEYF